MTPNQIHFYAQQEKMFNASLDNTFYIARNTPSNTFEYASFPSSIEFLNLYNELPSNQKYYYELIDAHRERYEYYDIDIKFSNLTNLTNNKLTNLSNIFVINWFINLRNNFINLFQNSSTKHKLANTKWIITTASNSDKISLHMLNKNIIFPNHETHTIFINALKNFLTSEYTDFSESFKNDPLIKSIDFNVFSKNRLMRITESSKPTQNRPLIICQDFHNNDYIPLEDTLITTAQNDKQYKLKTLYKEDLYTYNDNIINPFVKYERQKDDLGEDLENSENNTQHHMDENTIAALLNILSPDRCDEYNSWISIAMILKNSDYQYELFDSWSQQSYKYDSNSCKKTWNNISTKTSTETKEKTLTLATLYWYAKHDNPDAYKSIMEKHRQTQTNQQHNKNKHKIDLSFTQDLLINEKYIPAKIYQDYLKSHDILAIKSNMNTGKTYSLPNLFTQFQKIVVIYSRISLNVSIYNKWKQYGFEIYSDIKESSINTNLHNRVIVQIDSLHRLSGSIDLLILDEIETTHEHLCGSKLLEKTNECFQTLMNYTKYTPKIILADANLKDDTINHLLQTREQIHTNNNTTNILKIKNTYLSFCTIKTRFYFDEKIFFDKIQTFVKKNKKIVCPTNSKKKAKLLEKIILDVNPTYKILRIDMENRCTNVDTWLQYDAVIYTPTITAGVSFDHKHFDKVCAYFTKKSTSVEQSSQMLFRCRHLNDNEMHILMPPDDENISRPLEEEGIKEYINEKIKTGNGFLKQDGLKIDRYNQRVQETKYFKMYVSYLRKEHLSFSLFHSYMRQVLENHGAQISYEKFNKDDLSWEERLYRDEFSDRIGELNVEIKEEEALSICNATPISDVEYNHLVEKSKRREELTKEEMLAVKRYNLCTAFDKNVYENFSIDWVLKNIKYVYSVKRYKELCKLDLESAKTYCDRKKQENYNEMIYNKNILDLSDEDVSDDDTSDCSNSSTFLKSLTYKEINQRKKKKFLKHAGQTVHESINYDKTYQKLYHCMGILHSAGFKKVGDKCKIKPDFKAMAEYVNNNEHEIRVLFDCKKIEFDVEKMDEGNMRRMLMKYINSKLEKCLGVKIERFKDEGRCKDFVIKKLFTL
jgi:hypothetical protein